MCMIDLIQRKYFKFTTDVIDFVRVRVKMTMVDDGILFII
jgi:hypothetical protein